MITETLARFVAETRADAVPAAAVERARDALVDTLGVALAGAGEPVAEITARWVAEIGAGAQATVWGRTLASHAAEAAFANGAAAHALDFDDTHPSARGHASASLVPTVMAAGEAVGASGRDVLAAYVIGLEVAGKVGRMLGPGHLERGWHPTATVGVIGATAAAARLYGLDAATVARAFGVAGTEVSGLMRNFGTMTKPFHAGHAARAGIVAAWMARAGLTANPAIFETKGGVIDAYGGGDGEAPETVLASLADPWEALDPGNYVKRWPCCYSGHRVIGGLFEMIERHGLGPGEIDEVAIGFLPGGDTALVSRDPQTGLEGKFSIEYVIAALLLDGALTLDTFTDPQVRRPEARALMARVRRYGIPDDRTYSGIAGHNEIAVTSPRGRFELRVDRVPGSAAWPLTDADREAKFMDCAKGRLGPDGARRLLEIALACPGLADIRELARATVAAAGEPAV